MKSSRQITIVIFLIIIPFLTACAPAQAPATSMPPVSTNAPVPIATTLPSPLPADTATEIPVSSPVVANTSVPASVSACTASSGSWSSQASGSAPSIIFTIKDCTLTVVMVMGMVNGGWVTVSNEASQPITGSDFNYPYSFTDQDRYTLSGTFTSPTSATIKMVFLKGFHFTTDGPALADDLIFNATAKP